MHHATEMERIYEAERKAKDFMATLSAESVEKCGEARLLGELTHEFLLRSVKGSDHKEQ